jgi:hypothetical protein
MMGRQVHFYMAPRDEAEFWDFLHTSGAIHVYASCSPTVHPIEYACFAEVPEYSTGTRGSCWLWNEDVSPPPIIHPIPAQAQFCISHDSEVLQLNPCETIKGVLRVGRLYVDPFRLADGIVVKKSDQLLAWHARLVRWIRKTYRYDAVLGAYVGPFAETARYGYPEPLSPGVG